MSDRRTGEGAVAAFVVLLVLSLAGCLGNAGAGGSGEMVVPRAQLREIDGMEMTDVAQIAQPTTDIAAAATQPSAQPAPEFSLTIEQARQMALRNNLDLRVELLEPTIARTFLSEERAAFESIFVANAAYSILDSPTASTLSGSQVRAFSADAGIQIPLISGGSARFTVPIERFETNNQFSTLNPAYTSDAAASLSLPLLRGAGVFTNTQGIRIAFYDYQISQARTKLEVIRVLASVDRVYWRLYAARKQLEVRQKEYELAVVQLERAGRLVRAGAAAEVEIVRAESGVADRLEAIIIAENQSRDRQRELKRILNEPRLEMAGATRLIVETVPNATPYEVDRERLLATALDRRMEMLEQELRIAREASQLSVARNATLPLVLLDYTYNVNGLGGSFNESFEQLSDKDFEDHRLGVRLEVPLGNEAARSRLRRALASRQQALASRDQRGQFIVQEVLNAVDQLEANWQRIIAAQRRVVLAARVLEAETRQFERGLRTSTEVLDAQARLADARSAEINAIAEYQISQVDIAFAAGMVLGATDVVWDPILPPRQ